MTPHIHLNNKNTSNIMVIGCNQNTVLVFNPGIVTGWGCTFCLHTVVGEGRRRKDFLNPLPGPKSRSAVCRYCRPWPFTLLIYSYV